MSPFRLRYRKRKIKCEEDLEDGDLQHQELLKTIRTSIVRLNAIDWN